MNYTLGASKEANDFSKKYMDDILHCSTSMDYDMEMKTMEFTLADERVVIFIFPFHKIVKNY